MSAHGGPAATADIFDDDILDIITGLQTTPCLLYPDRFRRVNRFATVGRVIEWEKAREIYQPGLKHGMKLAAISGVNGVYSDEDIERVRELALAARARQTPVVKKAPVASKTAARSSLARKAVAVKDTERVSGARR